MTKHAEQRLAERFPGVHPGDTLRIIQHAFTLGALNPIAKGLSDADLYRFPLPDGRTAFPLITRAGVVKTVFADGMEFRTPGGLFRCKAVQIDGPGIYQMAPEDYHADPCPEPALSSGLAKLMINRSPHHAWTASPRLNPNAKQENKKHFDVGSAAHRELLGKGENFIAIPNTLLASNGAASTKAAKEFIEEARANGLTPLKAEEVAAVRNTADAARREMALHGIEIDPAYSEQVAIAEVGGVWNRIMVDYAPPGHRDLHDLKTTENASPEAVQRTIMNNGLQIQAWLYTEVWKAVTGEERGMCFWFTEKGDTQCVTAARIAHGTMVIARKQVGRAREMWRNCLDANDWPAYPHGIIEVDLPAYWQERWLERESAEADLKRTTGHDVLEHARKWQAPIQHAAE